MSPPLSILSSDSCHPALIARAKRKKSGFTLIDISIVLVIIGLIVGEVLVGRDLIEASRIRAQISQLEKFNLVANTFKLKYGYLLGDIPEPHASAFGFAARGTGIPPVFLYG
jgi:hypothetical protein